MCRAPLDALAAIPKSVLALGVSNNSGFADCVHARSFSVVSFAIMSPKERRSSGGIFFSWVSSAYKLGAVDALS